MDRRSGPRGSEDITWSVGNIKVRSSSKIAFNFEQIEPNIAQQLLEPQQAGFPQKHILQFCKLLLKRRGCSSWGWGFLIWGYDPFLC